VSANDYYFLVLESVMDCYFTIKEDDGCFCPAETSYELCFY